jgi:hypothetical protein
MLQVFTSEYKSLRLQNIESKGHRKLEKMFVGSKEEGTEHGAK